jgi:hypothetical protein
MTIPSALYRQTLDSAAAQSAAVLQYLSKSTIGRESRQISRIAPENRYHSPQALGSSVESGESGACRERGERDGQG